VSREVVEFGFAMFGVAVMTETARVLTKGHDTRWPWTMLPYSKSWTR
jgi:hypothetical protein